MLSIFSSLLALLALAVQIQAYYCGSHQQFFRAKVVGPDPKGNKYTTEVLFLVTLDGAVSGESISCSLAACRSNNVNTCTGSSFVYFGKSKVGPGNTCSWAFNQNKISSSYGSRMHYYEARLYYQSVTGGLGIAPNQPFSWQLKAYRVPLFFGDSQGPVYGAKGPYSDITWAKGFSRGLGAPDRDWVGSPKDGTC